MLSLITVVVCSAAQRVAPVDSGQRWVNHEAAATSYLMAGRPEDAVVEYQIALQLAPRQPELHEELGDAQWAASRIDESKPSYEAELALNPRCASCLFKLGSLEVIQSEPGKGVLLLRQALAIDPTLLVARYYLGRGERALGELQTALEDLSVVISNAKNDSVSEMAWYQLGLLYRKTGRPAQSSDAFTHFRELRERKAVSMSPEPIVPEDRKRELPRRPPSPM